MSRSIKMALFLPCKIGNIWYDKSRILGSFQTLKHAFVIKRSPESYKKNQPYLMKTLAVPNFFVLSFFYSLFVVFCHKDMFTFFKNQYKLHNSKITNLTCCQKKNPLHKSYFFSISGHTNWFA